MMLQNYTLVEFGKHGEKKCLQRFLKAHPNGDQYYFIHVETRKAMPYLLRKSHVDFAFEDGGMRIVADDYLIAGLRTKLEEKSARMMDNSYFFINSLDKEEGIFEPKRRGRLIDEIIDADGTVLFSESSFVNPERLIRKLTPQHFDESVTPEPNHRVHGYLWDRLSDDGRREIQRPDMTHQEKCQTLAKHFNLIISHRSIFDERLFAQVVLSPTIQTLVSEKKTDADVTLLNRLLFEAVFMFEIRKCGKVPTRETLYNQLRKFWQRGGSRLALQPNYTKNMKDKTRKPRVLKKDIPTLIEAGYKKWGTHKNANVTTGINVTMADKKNFRAIIDEHYHGQAKPVNFRRLHDLLLEKYYKGIERTKAPTIDQLRYYYAKKFPRHVGKEKREGSLVMNKKHRPATGSEYLRGTGPGSEFQIDSTIADIHLVNDQRNAWLGRPTMYLVVDTFSSMIVGVHITIENAQYSEAADAVWNAFDEKVAFCMELGIEITEAEWPAKGLPLRLLSDRGEVLSAAFDQVGLDLNLRMDTTPPHRPELKGMVERKFETLRSEQVTWLWGAVEKKEYDPKSKNPLTEARLTLKEFKRIIVHKILELNQRSIKEHPLREVLRIDGLETTPINLWKWGIENARSFLRTNYPNYVRAALLKPVDAVASRKGIQYEGLFWEPKNPIALKAMLTDAALIGVQDKTIRIQRGSVATVYVMGETYGSVVVCQLTARYAHFAKLSWAEYKLQRETGISTKQKDAEHKKRMETVSQTNQLNQAAHEQTQEQTGGQAPSRKNSGETREAAKAASAKDHLANTTTIVEGQPPAPPVGPLPPETVSSLESDVSKLAGGLLKRD